MKDPDVFELLRLQRKKLGLKQTDVGNEIGYTRSWVSLFENGRLRAATLQHIEKYANAVGMTVEYRLRPLSQEEARDD